MTTPCPNCGRPMSPFLRSYDYNGRVSTQPFDYARCPVCGVVGITQIPEDLGRYYHSSYTPYRIPTLQDLPRQGEAERYKLDMIEPFAHKRRLLEIGPSWGAFSYLARQSGFTVDAIEMDPECCAFLASTVGANVTQTADVLSALTSMGRYDVIAMWHAIEHLSRPFEVIDEACRHLNPGGVLAISTPNPESLQFQFFRSRWVHLDAPRHLYLIPSAALADRVRPFGLERVLERQDDWAGRVLNRMGWQSSIVNMSTSLRTRLAHRIAGRALADVMVHVDRWTGRGAAYTSVFVKPAA